MLSTKGLLMHINLIPVQCKNQDDMRSLAESMREKAVNNCTRVEYAASASEEEAYEKSEIVVPDIIKLGLLRFIKYEQHLAVNVAFTLRETDDGGHEWNLSISHGTTSGPKRVPDDLAKMIVDAFLEEGYTEVTPKAIWSTVRHFIKDEAEFRRK